MSYTVDFRLVRKTLRRLDANIRDRIVQAANRLCTNPQPPQALKLKGEEELWRIRVGNYRIIYTVEEDRLIILVVKIGHRREVYRGL